MAIDLDHLLIARLKTGNWSATRRTLATPSIALVDQDRIFEVGDVGILSRLLSHLVIVGVATPALVGISVPLAIVIAVVLYVHIVCDVCWDIWRLDQLRDRSRNELIAEMR